MLSKFTIVLGIKFSLYMFSNVFKNSVMFYRGAQVIIQRCSVKKVFLKISQNSQEDICTRVSVLKSCRPKKRLWHRCFPMKFANFLRTPIFIKYLWWLLLEVDSKSSLTSKDLFFAAIFRKISNPKCLIGFWIHLCFDIVSIQKAVRSIIFFPALNRKI